MPIPPPLSHFRRHRRVTSRWRGRLAAAAPSSTVTPRCQRLVPINEEAA